MPKINYRRGETRTFVFRADSGADARLRNQSRHLNSIRNFTRKGSKGLMKEHLEVFGGLSTRPTPRKPLATATRIRRASRKGWGPFHVFNCPCCLFHKWRRDLRLNARRRMRRMSSRAIRQLDRLEILSQLCDFLEIE